MAGSIGELAARMGQRKQRLEQERQQFDRVTSSRVFGCSFTFCFLKKVNVYAHNLDAITDPSEMESSRQVPPKPKRRHHRSSRSKSPFDDDSSMQFDYSSKHSGSTATSTSSNSARDRKKFLKKSTPAPVLTEKISVNRSPRDVSSPRSSARPTPNRNPPPAAATGLLTQSALLARAAHRQQLHAKGVELEPGAFDKTGKDDESSSDATSTSGSKFLFGAGKKSFLKKPANATPSNQVPELLHLDSETNNSEREQKKSKHKKNTRPPSGRTTVPPSLLPPPPIAVQCMTQRTTRRWTFSVMDRPVKAERRRP